MAIRFHLDEHLAAAVAEGLRVRGSDVTTTTDAALHGRSDVDHLAFAASQRRVMVTHDHGFTRQDRSGVYHCGICCCHSEKHTIGSLLQALLLVHVCFSEDETEQHLEYLWPLEARLISVCVVS